MASLITPARLFGNLAALAMLPVAGAAIIDFGGGWFGYHPGTLCVVLPPVVQLAGMVATLVVSLGVIIYVVSWFRSEGGLALMIGGALVFLAPMLLPHYMNASCTLPSTTQSNATP